MHNRARASARGRVNSWVPLAAVVVGAALAVMGMRWIGAGVAIGGLLAYANGLILSRRVDVAAAVGDFAAAFMVMQVGLLVTLTIIGAATIVLVKISLALAVATAASFGVAQLIILAAFYWTQGRRESPASPGVS